MKERLAIALLLVLCATSAVAGADRRINTTTKLTEGQEVIIDFPVGELEIRGTEDDVLRVELEARCKDRSSRCESRLEDIRVDIDETDGEVYVEVSPSKGWKVWNRTELDVTIYHPAANDLTVDMGVGELTVEDIDADVELDLGVGEVSVAMSVDSVESVDLDAGIGETSLRLPEGWGNSSRSFLIGSESSWRDGPGDNRIYVDVGVGEASVRLR